MSNPSWEPQYSRESEGSVGQPPDPHGYFHSYRLAPWSLRVAAGVVDWGLAGLAFALFRGVNETFAALAALAVLFANTGYLAATTSQSIGKRLTGIHMLRSMALPDGTFDLCKVPVEVGLTRVALHFLDCLLLWTGWIAPIWGKGRGTYADMITRTVNFADSRLPAPREQPSMRGAVPEWPNVLTRYDR